MGDTVTVKALQAHSYNGHDYAVGATYDLPAELVDSLKVQGKAEPVSAPAPPPAKPSKPVAPMTLDAPDAPLAKTTARTAKARAPKPAKAPKPITRRTAKSLRKAKIRGKR